MKFYESSISLLLASAAVSASAIPEIVLGGDKTGSVGAVACESSECSAIGRDLLARGGNAVDAMVGTVFCVGVVGMYHSGIGGGGFAMIRDKKGNYEAVDFRESAPSSASEDMYRGNKDKSIVGGQSVAVPSEVYGLEYIHKKYGTLPWKTTMAGAIHVARNGFKVSADLVVKMNDYVKDNTSFLIEDPSWAEDFAPNGRLVQQGEVMTRKRYANTLEKIAKHGSKAFYTGEIADDLIETINSAGGNITLSDLQNYKIKFPPVQHNTFRGLDIYAMSAPAGGSVAMYILKLMEKFPPFAWYTSANLTYHRFSEAMRFGYSARGHLGDPKFVDELDVKEFERKMLNQSNIENVQKQITDDTSHPPKYYNPENVWLPESHGTSHLSAADESGMAIALTTTINLIWGSQLMDKKSGIILNDEMNDFSIPGVDNEFGLKPSVPNFIRPHKRPLSSMTPLIAAYPNGTLYAVLGASGGSRIISATAQVLWHVVDHEMTLKEAMKHPRLHDQLYPNRVNVEIGFPEAEATEEYLRSLGHDVKFVRPGQSCVQGILLRPDSSFEAVGEPRQNNSAGLTL